MKKTKSTILASIFVMALIASVVSVGTIAYFSETAIVNPTFASGDPDIQINVNDGTGWSGWDDGPVAVSTPTGWAPGDDDYTLTIRVKNVGDSGLLMAGIGGSNPSGDTGLADKIEITLLRATEYTDADYMLIPISYWQGVFDGGAPLTLSEFVASSFTARFWEGGVPITSDYLDAGGTDIKEIMITFQFMTDAGNAYQGLTYTFDLTILGTDDPSLSGTG